MEEPGEIMADPKPKPEIADPDLAEALARLGAAIDAHPKKARSNETPVFHA
jgi:hypothetical protein